MEPPDTIDLLLGEWRVSRAIDDRASSTKGSFDGRCSFTELPLQGAPGVIRRALYDEHGELEFGGFRGPTRRSLIYELLSDGGVQVLFSDSRPFVDLDLRSGRWESRHPCAEDLYEISTELRSPDEIEERWRVRGPTKDYDATTRLTRSRDRS